MIRIAICDDELLFQNQIAHAIHTYETHLDVVTKCFDNGDELLKAHSEAPFDIIFLDIVMPLFHGMDIAKELRTQDKNVKIVFLTSSTEYAVDSYTVKAANYLLKPLSVDKFHACLTDLFEDFAKDAPSILVKTSTSLRTVLLNQIEYVEAQNRYIVFSLTTGETLKTLDPLYSFINKLTVSDGFYKCHRSYIINMHFIDSYTSKEVKMHSGALIPISRSCHVDFKESYFSYFFRKAGE